MNFLRFPAKSSHSLPLTLRMMLVNEGVKTGIYAGSRVLSHAELISTNIIDSLPSPLAEFLHQNINIPDHIYVLAWPDAKNLYDRLKAHDSSRLILECESVANLITIERPKNFAIQWVYDAAQKCLERHLINAERYLGRGWFQQDQFVWQLDNDLPEITLKWLSMYQIHDRDVFWFVSHFIPTCQRWPISSNLGILNNYTLRLKILKMQERSIEVQLAGNVGGVAERLEYLDSDPENMISGTMLLPRLHLVMSDKLLQLAHTGTAVQIEGTELPAFIQDHLRPHAAQLGIDIDAVDRKYPIVDAKTLPLEWKLEHKMVHGIGQYFAIPQIGDFALSTAINHRERFHSSNKGWIEFSPAISRKFDGISEFQLNPREILGFPSSRLKLARVQLPRIELARGEQVAGFISTLKFHGLPGGFSGFQTEASDILAAESQRILKDDLEASILWIMPQKKRPVAGSALQRLHLSYTDAEYAAPEKNRVTLLSPGANVELPKNWSLIILQDLDILALSDTQIHFYSQLNRNWTLATFATDKWFEATRSISQVMLALQLVPENLQAFREKCFQTYPDRVSSLRPKLIPPFKVSTSLGANVGPIRTLPVALPIPPALPETTPPPMSTPPQPKKESFVAQAHRYVNRAEPETMSVPFAQYWPTYDAMTDAQQKWYFYWRSQVRQGNYLPADLSYLFVHVYEVINMVGFDSPQNAFDYLVRFWQQYHASQPKLDCYLVDWLADFASIYKLRLTPLGWYDQVRQAGATFGDFDLYIEAWVQTGGHFTDLPSKFLYRLAAYSPTSTKFYQEYSQHDDLDLAYKKGVQTVDDYLTQHGKSLIEMYRPAQTRAIVREPFAGALCELDRKPVFIANADTWSANLMLPPILASIIKYTENVLRTQANFKTMLLGADVPKEWGIAIEHSFAPHPEVEINTAKVRLLKRESDEIRQRLIVDDPQEFVQAPLSQLQQVTAIMDDSHSVGTKLLRVLREHDWVADETTLDTVIEQGRSLNTELDYLNRRAIKELGDGLIVATNGQFMVAQDYRDEIEYVLDHAEHDQDKVSSTMSVVPSSKYTELTEEWAKFAQQMKPYHWEALAVLLGAVDLNARLESVARSVYSTASRLIDDIKTFALDSIGDIVISTQDGTPHIEQEDVDGLQLLLAWANGIGLLENQI